MGYAVYGAKGSGSAFVEATLLEIGVDYEFRAIDAKNHAQRGAEYAAINPHRKMPTLITPEGETLTESAAIVMTLAERHPEAALLPAPASRERAQALRWLMFAVGELYPLVELMDYPARFADEGEEAAGRLRARALAHWRSRWQTLESQLSNAPYLLGSRFCAADLYLAGLSRWDLPRAWRLEHIPKVERLAVAVAERPALRELWATNFPYP